MLKLNIFKALIVILALIPSSQETCKVQIERVNCKEKDSNLLYTCHAELHEEDCVCIFENPFHSEFGWLELCKKKNELKEKKKVVRKRQVPTAGNCRAIQPPRPGKVYCSLSSKEISCRGKCFDGYKFSDLVDEHYLTCSYWEGIWIPNTNFPDCKPVCSPPCQNGGVCVAPSVCSCPNEYRGERCQYSLALCAISKNFRASSWHCDYTRKETVCNISCHAPRTRESFIDVQKYICRVDGTWSPPLPPCVDGSNLCADPGNVPFGAHLSLGSEFKIGTVLTFKCDAGYTILGNDKITCGRDGRWVPEKPICVEQKPDIPMKNIEIRNILDITPKEIIPDQCPKPNAPKNSVVIVSYPDQVELRKFFSSDIPLLQRLYLTMMKNFTENKDLPESNGLFLVGTRVQYKCKSRFYRLYGSEYQTCQASLTWSGYQPACVPECGKSDSPKIPFIVNGNSTNVGQWPWMVGIGFKNTKELKLICGGVLINELWVLTAAHCVTKLYSNTPMDPKNMLLFLGKYYSNFSQDDEYVQRKKVKQIIIYEEYDFIHFDGDIALLRLEDPVELTTRVQPICLPNEVTTRENVRDGKRGIVIGWGLTENGSYANALRETVLPVVNHDKCEEAYREGLRTVTVTKNMFCAGFESGSSDTCSGDSGGPYMFPIGPSNDNRWYLEGLVSWGSESGCAKPQRYSGFTKVGAFVSWINMYI